MNTYFAIALEKIAQLKSGETYGNNSWEAMLSEIENFIISGIEVDKGTKKDPVTEKIEDWVADLALKDNGKVFMKDTNEKENAPVNYGDLRKLMRLLG